MIRRATPADAPAIVAMTVDFMRETQYGALLTPAPGAVEAIVEGCLTLHNGVAFVLELPAEHGLELAGVIAAMADTNPITGTPLAQELIWWVRPDARQQLVDRVPVGLALLRELEAWCLSIGVLTLRMSAPAGNRAVCTLLERSGYTPVEVEFVIQLR